MLLLGKLALEMTFNIFTTQRVADTANGCLVLDRAGTTAERHERELKAVRNFIHALLLSASGELLPSLQTYHGRRITGHLDVVKRTPSRKRGQDARGKNRSSHP